MSLYKDEDPNIEYMQYLMSCVTLNNTVISNLVVAHHIEMQTSDAYQIISDLQRLLTTQTGVIATLRTGRGYE